METNIHPQVRRLVVQLCEAFNTPLTEVKLKVWQDKLKIPNSTILKEAYDIITDGKGASLKMPSIAEFMQIYKERERLYTKKRIETSQQLAHKDRDYSKSKKMFSNLRDMIKKGEPVNRGVCGMPVDGVQDGRKFTLTRDSDGKDYVQFHN